MTRQAIIKPENSWENFRRSRLSECTIFLVFYALIVEEQWLKDNLWMFYLAQGFCVFNLIRLFRDRWLFILSPACITVMYLLTNFTVGSYAFSRELVFKNLGYFAYLDWAYLGITASFFLLANVIIICAHCYALRKIGLPLPLVHKEMSGARPKPSELYFVVLFVVAIFVFFSVITFDLSAIGIKGTISPIPKGLAALAMVILLARFQVPGRFFFYLLILAFFASFSSQSKREAIFLLLPMLLVSVQRWRQPKIQLKWAIGIVLFLGFSSYLIVMMSIYRGYGQYQPDTFWDSRNYVSEYLQSPLAYEYLLNNFEINYSFFHSHQSIEYILEEPELILFGATFAKILFIPLPRRLFPSKPDGIVHHYTYRYSPEFREDGGSWASTHLSEFFWNFHFAGLIVLFILYFWISRFFVTFVFSIREGMMYSHLFGLYAYQHFLGFVRGSGSDTYAVYLLMGGVFCYVVFLPVLTIIQNLAGKSRKRYSPRPTQPI